jgi:hypothetical protein
MTTNVDITKRALAQIGTHSQITSMSDGSEEANYANLLYNPLRDFLLTEGDYDFSLTSVALTVSGGAGSGWNFSYSYPTGALRVRSLIPLFIVDFDPAPIEFNIYESGGTRFVFTKEAASEAIITTAPVEDLWDPIFTEAFTRLLASALSFSLENRIEASKEKLSEALNFAGIANLRDP